MVQHFCNMTVCGELVRDPKYFSKPSWELTSFRINIAYHKGAGGGGTFLDCKIEGDEALPFSDNHNAGDPVVLTGTLKWESFTTNDGRLVKRHYMDVDRWFYAKEKSVRTRDTATREMEEIAGEKISDLVGRAESKVNSRHAPPAGDNPNHGGRR